MASGLLRLPSNASPQALAAASFGLGSLATYLYAKSKTETPLEDMKELVSFVKWKRDIDSKVGSGWSIADTIEDTVSKNMKKTCLIYVNDGSSYTWAQVNERANQGLPIYTLNN